MRWIAVLLLFFYPLSAQQQWVYIDWDGVNDEDGDGSLTFNSLGQTLTATLSVRTNATNGYNIIFYSSNATGKNISWLQSGSQQIRYIASMDVSGVQNANIRRAVLNLKNSNSACFTADFNKSGNVIPLTSALANLIRLDFSLDYFNGTVIEMGTYVDIITATASLN